MARFNPHRIPFGRPALDDEDEGAEGLPTPARIKLAARRAAGITAACGKKRWRSSGRVANGPPVAIAMQRLWPCSWHRASGSA